MTTALERRLGAVERRMGVEGCTVGSCFVMAPDASAAKREIARLKAVFGERLPRTMFVMTLADRRVRGH